MTIVLRTRIQAVPPQTRTQVQVHHLIHPVQIPHLTQTLAPAVPVQTGTGKRRKPEVRLPAEVADQNLVKKMRVTGKGNQTKVIEKNRQKTKVLDVLTKTMSKISYKNIWPRLKNVGERMENNSKKQNFSCIINRLKKHVNIIKNVLKTKINFLTFNYF